MKILLFVALVLFPTIGMACESPDGLPVQCPAVYGDPEEAIKEPKRSRQHAQKFEWAVREGQLRSRTNLALDALVKYASYRLRQRGYKQEAADLLKDWQDNWNGYLVRNRDVGDHAPLNQWLAEKYAIIELILGKNVCRWLRLEDIQTLNFAIPVVFSCVDNVDLKEYSAHFVPFSGVVVYWTSFFGCVGGTWGTGFLFCSPISWGAELLTEKFIAPAVDNIAWGMACHH